MNWSLNVRSKEELEQRSRDVYGETDEKVDQALSALDDWIKKSPHLQKIRYDRQVKFFSKLNPLVSAFLPPWMRAQRGEDKERTRLLLLGQIEPACLVLWLGPKPGFHPANLESRGISALGRL